MAENNQHPVEEYVNLQRIASDLAFGPVPELSNTMEWIFEYGKIQKKVSNLSANKRRIVASVIENAQEKFRIDTENGNTEKFDHLNEVVSKIQTYNQQMRKFASTTTKHR